MKGLMHIELLQLWLPFSCSVYVVPYKNIGAKTDVAVADLTDVETPLPIASIWLI